MAMNQGIDRRVRRTRSLLHGALASLIHEKSYDDIVVKEILSRADVGRSTFYSHFRDKDELLESGIRDLLRAGEATSPSQSTYDADRVLRFSSALFEHIERYRDAARLPATPERLAGVHDRLERELAALVADDLERLGSQHGVGHEQVQHLPPDLLAKHIASTFLVVLNWWMGSAAPIPASKANELFRALVLPTFRRPN